MTTYLLDSNVFIQAKNSYYGLDFCPAFWDWLDREHANGAIYSVDAVLTELRQKDDELTEWANQRAGLFQSPDAKTVSSLSVVSQWVGGAGKVQRAVDKFMRSADYYLVGQAHAYRYTVVTHEKLEKTPNKVKIPEVCTGIGVECVTLYEMLRAEKASFVLGP